MSKTMFKACSEAHDLLLQLHTGRRSDAGGTADSHPGGGAHGTHMSGREFQEWLRCEHSRHNIIMPACMHERFTRLCGAGRG